MATVVVADQTCELEQSVLAGQQRQFASANWVIVQRLLPLLAILAGDHLHVSPLTSYGGGSLLVLAAVIIRPIKRWVTPRALGEIVKTSRGYWAAALVSSIGSLDLTVVRIFGGAIPAGLYGAANRATNPISILLAELLIIITPAASRAETPNKRGEILRLAMLASVVIAGIMTILSPLISTALVTVLGRQYLAAHTIITSFVVAAAISGISQTIQARLYTEGRPLVAAKAIGIGTIAGLCGLGYLGAS